MKHKEFWLPEYKKDARRVKRLIDLVSIAYFQNHSDKPYHNWSHMVDVYDISNKYGSLLGLHDVEKTVLAVGSLGHDVIYEIGASDNEEGSADYMSVNARQVGFGQLFIDAMKGAILATKVPQSPSSLIEEIICDADLRNLGDSDFFAMNDRLRREFGIGNSREEMLKWYEGTLNFMNSHAYHTPIARSLRNEGKARNVKELERRYDELKAA